MRGTSESTVRDHLKKTFSKMNVKSQSEIIRLALPVTDTSVRVADTAAPFLKVSALSEDWLEQEVWRPFRTLRTLDGRRLDYHVMGPPDGLPILYSHMGYCQARWSRSMIGLTFKHGLRVICPIRAGYGQSDNLHPKADVLQATRADTLLALETLGISKLPYIAHGNDLIFAADLVCDRPDMISEIIGVCARPCLPGDVQLLGTGKWQRYFMSTAKHAPKLVHFGAKAGVAMGKQIGLEAMYRQVCKNSPTDLAMLDIAEMRAVLLANNSLVIGKDSDVSQAFAMEYIALETDWSDKLVAARDTPIQILLGEEDPTVDPASDHKSVMPTLGSNWRCSRARGRR
jgi:pimeloyl-ACP methyl ester carboxylesterase